MGARQYAGRHRQRTHREQIATIDAWRAIENAVADDLGFELMELGLQLVLAEWCVGSTRRAGGLADVAHRAIALLLVHQRVRLRNLRLVAGSELGDGAAIGRLPVRSEEHTSELPVTNAPIVCRLLL